MINFNLQVFEKKCLRSLISNFDYNHELVQDIDNILSNRNLIKEINRNIYYAYLYIFDKKEVTEDYIKNLYSLLYPFCDKALPNSETLSKVVNLYLINDFGFRLSNYLLNNRIFGNATGAVFTVLLNKKLLCSEYSYLFLFGYDFKKLKLAQNLNDYCSVLKDIVEKNKKVYIKFEILSEEEISRNIYKIDTKILDFLNVKEIRLFGSYYNDSATEYSDLDFLIITDDNNYDKDLTISLLGKSFTDLFKQKIDLHVIDINQKYTNKFDFMVLLNSKILSLTVCS